ncbi:unnamed protein product, partial [Prorocentrum cordatum]
DHVVGSRGDGVFVKFYAPWCGHCKELAPVWQSAAETLHGTVDVAEVDCTANVSKGLRRRFDISGYPTIKLFRNGTVYRYRGNRSKASLVEFASGGRKRPHVVRRAPAHGARHLWEVVAVRRRLARRGLRAHGPGHGRLGDGGRPCRGRRPRQHGGVEVLAGRRLLPRLLLWPVPRRQLSGGRPGGAREEHPWVGCRRRFATSRHNTCSYDRGLLEEATVQALFDLRAPVLGNGLVDPRPAPNKIKDAAISCGVALPAQDVWCSNAARSRDRVVQVNDVVAYEAGSGLQPQFGQVLFHMRVGDKTLSCISKWPTKDAHAHSVRCEVSHAPALFPTANIIEPCIFWRTAIGKLSHVLTPCRLKARRLT